MDLGRILDCVRRLDGAAATIRRGDGCYSIKQSNDEHFLQLVQHDEDQTANDDQNQPHSQTDMFSYSCT